MIKVLIQMFVRMRKILSIYYGKMVRQYYGYKWWWLYKWDDHVLCKTEGETEFSEISTCLCENNCTMPEGNQIGSFIEKIF